MEQGYDDELEKLLREIPGATSAPPQHLSYAKVMASRDEETRMIASSVEEEDSGMALQSDSHNTNKGKKNVNASSSNMNINTPSDATNQSRSTTMSDSSFMSRLPSSLQLVDPFPSNPPLGFLENELNIGLEKMSLSRSGGLTMENRAPGIRFLHNAQPLMEAHPSNMQLGYHQQVMGNRPHHPSNMLPPYTSDLKMAHAHQLHEAAAAAHAQQQLEERMYCRQRIKEELLLRQQKLQEQQARFYASMHNPSGPPYSRSYSGSQIEKTPSKFDLVQQQPSPKTTLGGMYASDGFQSSHGMWANPIMLAQESPQASHICRYFLHGFCTRGDLCPFPHSQSSGIAVSNNMVTSDSTMSRAHKGPRNAATASTLVLPPLKTKSMLVSGHSNGHLLSNGNHLMPSSNQLGGIAGGAIWNGISPEILQQSLNNQHQPQQSPSPPPKYTTLKEVEGRIYGIAKDQHGCRFLQKKFEEGVFEDVQKIFVEIIDHVVELMTDPFGNYLVQKLLEVCDEDQRMAILYRVTGKGQLVTISLNMHGTRAVQKLIEMLKTPEQIGLVISSLRQGVVTLIKDLNGNHVVQRCLQRLSTEDSQFIFDAAASHCVEIATHRHGCCVLQRCVDFSMGQQRERLVAEIAANALVLSQDAFGNYVVQYILDLGLAWAVAEVIDRLDGNFVHLAMQKFSSNVVEKCLKLGGDESRAKIIQELTSSTRLAQLLQDPFANYVVQSALTVSKGALYVGLVEAIRPHLPALRSSPYGKRILSRTSLKK